jgi:hypothetical protein
MDCTLSPTVTTFDFAPLERPEVARLRRVLLVGLTLGFASTCSRTYSYRLGDGTARSVTTAATSSEITKMRSRNLGCCLEGVGCGRDATPESACSDLGGCFEMNNDAYSKPACAHATDRAEAPPS